MSQCKEPEGAAAGPALTSPSSGSDTGPWEHPGNGITSLSNCLTPAFAHARACSRGYTDCGVDLAVICAHAVSMVQVGERLGGAPGLQVARHSDGRPHLPAVQRGARAQTQQGAVPLALGRQ